MTEFTACGPDLEHPTAIPVAGSGPVLVCTPCLCGHPDHGYTATVATPEFYAQHEDVR